MINKKDMYNLVPITLTYLRRSMYIKTKFGVYIEDFIKEMKAIVKFQ